MNVIPCLLPKSINKAISMHSLRKKLLLILYVLALTVTPALSDGILTLYSQTGSYHPDTSRQQSIVLTNGINTDIDPTTNGYLFPPAQTSPVVGSEPVPSLSGPEQRQPEAGTGTRRIIVTYPQSTAGNAGTPIPSIDAEMKERYGAAVLTSHYGIRSPGFQVVEVPSASFDGALAAYRESSLVGSAEADYQISLEPSQTGTAIITLSGESGSVYPNDPGFLSQWGLCNTGQSPFNGIPGADVSAQEAWEISTGSSEIVVAVLDTGIDTTHQDLAANIWTNPGEIPGNQVDDDGNGYIDDIHGWNFVGNSNDISDDNGHGTHCAGTIGAVGNNNLGICGLSWNLRLMPIKIIDSAGNGKASDAVSAILYANQMGADVISCSFTGTQYSEALNQAVCASSAVVVCASGNGGKNIEEIPIYPAAFDIAHSITVAATDASDNLASFSNYGSSHVDIAAPGVTIASTYPGNRYAYMSGTSMATPFVSGVAALIRSANPALTNTETCSILLDTVDRLPALQGMISTGGRLNAYQAVSQAVSGTGAGMQTNPALPGTSPILQDTNGVVSPPVSGQVPGDAMFPMTRPQVPPAPAPWQTVNPGDMAGIQHGPPPV